MALAAAVAYTGRSTILVFSNGYHGGTMTFHSGSSGLSANLPHHFVVATYNGIDGSQAVLEAIFADLCLAAIIVEPIHG